MQKITPNLWFDGVAEQAAQFYVSIFKNSRITNISRYGESGAHVSGQPQGSVMMVVFELDGQEFVGINGGPLFKFSEAISFAVTCETQAEIDEYWDKLTTGGGEPSVCGWLKDKYGLSWQIVPRALSELMTSGSPEAIERMQAALYQMKKIDITTLERAFHNANPS